MPMNLPSRVHDRMPVRGRHYRFMARWVRRAQLLHPAPENLLQVWPVSKRVNRSADCGDDPTLIDRIIVVDAA
jgi:putative SOS response-associated peptidase YedK